MDRDYPLHGRVAIVTGASSGVGLETARRLADAGVRVHAVARRLQAMTDGAGQERLEAGGFVPHALDVTDAEAVERLVEQIAHEGPIDVLIAAAGANLPGRTLDELPPGGWDEMVAVNLSGAFYVLRAALPHLRAARGDVILISSIAADLLGPAGSAYAAAKAGVRSLGRAAALEEQERGVRISTILPGAINTPLLDRRPDPPDAETRARSLQPEDVAETCLFLLSLPRRAYIPELIILPTIQTLGRQ